ncbi:MAG: hypothetical protein ACREJ2_10530 [Planctomycetota bacterium]
MSPFPATEPVAPIPFRGELEFEFLRPTPELTDAELHRAMGLAAKRPVRPNLRAVLEKMVADLLPEAQPRLVLGVASARTMLAALPEYPTFERYLESAERAVLIAGSAGLPPGPDDPFADPLLQYVRNAVAIALVRKLFTWARRHLQSRWPEWTTAEPLTPGNCGIPLEMQSAFLNQLPIVAVDIAYDPERNLLTPLASISGLIGVGRYPAIDGIVCSRCPSQHCPLREADFNPEKFRELNWYCARPKLEA